MADNLCEVGGVLCDVASVAYDHSSLAYQADRAHDIVEELNDRSNSIEASKSLTHVEQRKLKNQQTLQKSMVMAKVVLKNMMEQPVEDTLTSIAEMSFDALLTVKAIESIGYVSSKVGNKLVETGNELKKILPPKMMDETVVFMQTSGGELIAVSEKSSKSIPKAAQAQAVVNKAERIKKHAEKTKSIVDDVAKLTRPIKEEVIALEKELAKIRKSVDIINRDRLMTISKDVKQVENFRNITKNFDPALVAQLHHDEILYLNLCDWLEPQVSKINTRLQAQGGMVIIDSKAGVEVVIKEYDIYHSLLGEIKPGSVRETVKGGHWFCPELRAASFDVQKIKSCGNGFFDMQIRQARRVTGDHVGKTYFPAGKSIEQCITILEEAMSQEASIKYVIPDYPTTQKAFEAVHVSGQKFVLRVDNGVAKFYPWSINPKK